MPEYTSLAAFLEQKKIDVEQLKAQEPELWQEWEQLWQQMSPASFDMQKKFLFNRLRRRFLLASTHTDPSKKP